jgi:hypothetical protein
MKNTNFIKILAAEVKCLRSVERCNKLGKINKSRNIWKQLNVYTVSGGIDNYREQLLNKSKVTANVFWLAN